MTDQQCQEAVSREFLRILAHMNGYKVYEPALDHGVDMTICPVKERIEPSGQRRFLDSQMRLDFQIKSTTVAGVEVGPNVIKYDLEAKTFNDLVQRRVEPLPLHLLLVVLNDRLPACVAIDQNQISVVGSAFWFLPEEDEEPTANVSTKRIAIPRANIIQADFVRSCYERLEIEP